MTTLKHQNYIDIRTGGTAGTFGENGRKSTRGIAVFAECHSKINAIRSSPWQGSKLQNLTKNCRSEV